MLYTCFHNGVLLSGINKFEKAAILIKDTKIVDIFNEDRFEKKQKQFPTNTHYIDVKGSYISPGFIDTHIHGFAGHGIDKLFEDSQSLLKMAQALPQYGVTSFLATLYPKPVSSMQDTLRLTVENIEYQKSLLLEQRGSCIAGIHLEGPFISKKQLGVHKEECSSMPDTKIMQNFIDIGKGYIRNMTVAPELKGMHEIAIMGIKNNIVLQAGHTNAGYKHIIEGVQVGILHSTHFFNAMSRLHHRDPGTVGAILLDSSISCEIIADGYHVHPLLIRLLMRNKPKNSIVLITDALSSTLQKEGVLIANDQEVYLKDGIFYTKNEDVIAGSSLTMQQGIKNIVEWGISLEQAIAMASYNPASIIKIPKKGMLCPGYDADIIVFNNNLEIQYTMIEGYIAYDNNFEIKEEDK